MQDEFFMKFLALAEKRDYQGAIEHYTKALQINPDYKEAKHNLRITKKLKKQESIR